VNFISGLMVHKVPFGTVELGADTDPFLLHLFAALAERGSKFGPASPYLFCPKDSPRHQESKKR
jgi:hypothetical protein